MARKNVTQATAKAKPGKAPVRYGKDANGFDHDLWYALTDNEEEIFWPEHHELVKLLCALREREDACKDRLFEAIPMAEGYEHIRAFILKSTRFMDTSFAAAAQALQSYASMVRKAEDLSAFLEQHIHAVRGAEEARQ